MTTYNYYGPSIVAERRGKCPVCGKPTRRRQTFQGTVNPFNRRPDGAIKTWPEVRADVEAKADAWNPPPDVFEHEKCRHGRITQAGGVA